MEIVDEEIEAFSNAIMAAKYYTPAATTQLHRIITEGKALKEEGEN